MSNQRQEEGGLTGFAELLVLSFLTDVLAILN